jgi:hypothetical protein
MVQRSEPAGVEPTEQSPLLVKPGNANGHGEAYVPIAEISPEGSVNGNGGNGSLAKIRSQDEESRGSGEVEEGVGTANVARIISVLLIGAPSLGPRLQSWDVDKNRHLCRTRGWLHSPGNTPHHRFRVQRLGEFKLADYQFCPGGGSHPNFGA